MIFNVEFMMIFITSSHMYWKSPGRGSGVLATFKLLTWHMLSYETTIFFQSSLVLCPNAATSQVKISKNTCTGPSDLCQDSKIGKTLMIITSIGVLGVHVICCYVLLVVRLVGELLLTGKVAATFEYVLLH